MIRSPTVVIPDSARALIRDPGPSSLSAALGPGSPLRSGRDDREESDEAKSGQLQALGVYIHWPYCARICPYCDFAVVRDRGRRGEQAALVEAIAADLTAHAALTGPATLVSVFLGGGTPSLMEPDDAGRLIALARSLWTPAADVEVTLEANPTDAEAGRFAAFAAAGVNRLSLGLQALDDDALAFLGRDHDAASGIRAARAGGRAFSRLSLDLIYARPGLPRAADLGAEHLSPYQLTIEAGTPFDRAVRRARFAPPGESLAADLYDATQATLERLGFEAYEVSNHARGAPARSRHNQVYWRGEAYVGVGPAAHGRLWRDGRRWATEAARRPADYVTRVRETGVGWVRSEALDPVAAAEERLLMGLRLLEGVPLAELAPLSLKLDTSLEQGLATVSDGRLAATPRGRLVLDRLTAELVGV